MRRAAHPRLHIGGNGKRKVISVRDGRRFPESRSRSVATESGLFRVLASGQRSHMSSELPSVGAIRKNRPISFWATKASCANGCLRVRRDDYDIPPSIASPCRKGVIKPPARAARWLRPGVKRRRRDSFTRRLIALRLSSDRHFVKLSLAAGLYGLASLDSLLSFRASPLPAQYHPYQARR